MFWAVIKCNLRQASAADEFNAWYNQHHAPRHIAQPATVRRDTIPWDGVWGDHIRNWEISFYRKLYDHEERERAHG